MRRPSRMPCQFDTDFFDWSGCPEVRIAPTRYLWACWIESLRVMLFLRQP